MPGRRLLRLVVLLGSRPGCGDPGTSRSSQPAIGRDLPAVTDQVAALPDDNVDRPEVLAATGAPLPVVVRGDGGCIRYGGLRASLMASWARAGVVVVAVTVAPVASRPGGSGVGGSESRRPRSRGARRSPKFPSARTFHRGRRHLLPQFHGWRIHPARSPPALKDLGGAFPAAVEPQRLRAAAAPHPAFERPADPEPTLDGASLCVVRPLRLECGAVRGASGGP